MLLLGESVNGGLYGAQPSLTDLDDNGDLKMQVDFRSVYATVLDDWMRVAPEKVLSARFPKLGLVNG
jgi:uncharacterized protein (DUF1501 family)